VKQDLAPLAPEIILAASAVAGLLAGSWLPRARQWLIRALAAAACLAGLAVAGLAATQPATTGFGGSYVIDTATSAVRSIVLAATLPILALAAGPFTAHPRETEIYVLLQLAALATIMLAGAGDLLLLFAAYLLASIPGYALAGFGKDAPGTEAAKAKSCWPDSRGMPSAVPASGACAGHPDQPPAVAAAPAVRSP
jgi:NADH-quinone oxidoreductase subunit N